MQDINILEELEKVQVELRQRDILNEAQSILTYEVGTEQSIISRIRNASDEQTKPAHLIQLLDQARIFDLKAIESICTKFRLRFLDSSLFKDEIPAEAIREVKRLEAMTGFQFDSFHIIAPSERFKLKDSTKDPILLAELPNGKYFYIYQWGNDMSWYQHLLKYPFRHMGTLTVSALMIGALITLLVPMQFEDFKAEFFYRFFMFSMTSALVLTLAIITGIMYSKDFSENVWNSKFLR